MSFTVHTPRRNSFVNYLAPVLNASHSHGSAQSDVRTKQFANGDTYSGSWRNNYPDGEGRYLWPDGSWYEGSWKDGRKHGCGRCIWASGETYNGEWHDDLMHGTGTLTAPSGSRYQGGWHMDLKHGLGKQVFSNGDSYEGLWRRGKQDGPGRYVFASGDEYDGEWRAGTFNGSGTFAWASGERYDGQWKDGKPDGVGVLTLPDGALYDAQWARGKRHGVCLYRPPTPRSLDGSPGGSGLGLIKRGSFRMSDGQHGGAAPARAVGSFGSPSYTAAAYGGDPSVHNPFASCPPSPALHAHARGGEGAGAGAGASPGGRDPTSQDAVPAVPVPGGGQPGGSSACVRVYQHGRVAREWVMGREEAGAILAALSRNRPGTTISRLLRKAGGPGGGVASPPSGSDKRLGEAIFKGHGSYELMLNLQLGIRYSVSRITPEAGPKELGEDDFGLKVTQYFPREGSEMTPVHASEEFLWKDYAPMAFRKLRELFGVEAGDYMLSLCSNAALRQLNTPGKSGAVFFLSDDDRFFAKTLKKGEAKLLFGMLPAYYRHMSSHPHTLLTKFYGLHRITTASGRQAHFVVMANLFNTCVQLHRKYDLKGSRLGRSVGPASKDDPHAILKDLDLDFAFRLEEGWLDRLLFQVKADTGLLESCHIMDYSMLLGVHYRNRGDLVVHALGPSRTTTTSETADRQPGAADATVTLSGGSHDASKPPTLAQMRSLNKQLLRPQNFAELSLDHEYNMEFPRLCEKVARFKMPDEARQSLLSLIRTRLGAGGKAAMARRAMMDMSSADALALQLGGSYVQLGVNMPATAIPSGSVSGGYPEEVVLYFGIIDILQDYNPTKKLEHSLKAILHDSYSISVTHPRTYAQRFQSFMRAVFV